MCDHGCGIKVVVAEGQPVSLKGAKEHPYNKGWLCAKGRAALDFFHHPKRIATPLIKKEGKFVPVDWNRSMDFAAETLNRLKDQYGPATLAIYHGEGVGHQEIKYYMKRFANVYGTPNFMGVGSLCNASRTIAETLTIGGLSKPDIPNTRFLIIWGGNPLISNEPSIPPIGSEKFPLFCQARKEAHALSLAEAILDERPYPIKAMIIAGGNLLCYTHWQFRYISKLRKMSPEPIFEIHPNTANQYGILDGEMAEVRSPFGKIRLKACLTRNMLPDTIHISQGWEEANANELTGTENADPVSGFPNLKSMQCNIQKL